MTAKRRDMDFKAIIELVKYTLAIPAACFVYTLEKLTPAPTEWAKWFALAILVLLFVSTLGGIFIFSSATAALHGDKDRAERQEKWIRRAACIHIGCMVAGVLLLGGRLVEKVLT